MRVAFPRLALATTVPIPTGLTIPVTMGKHLVNVYYIVVCISVHMTGALGHRKGSSEEEIVTTTEAGPSACPDGFQLFESSCYRLVSDSPTDGYTARTQCQTLANDSHLAFIQSQSEMDFLQGLAKERGEDEDYWFGLTYTTNRSLAQWLDGTPVGNFTAWDGYGVFDDSSPCVRLRRDSDYLWNDRPCSRQFGYICEAERGTDDVTPLTTPSPKAVRPPVAPPTPTAKSAGFKSGPLNMAAPIDNHLLQSVPAPSLIRCAKLCLAHSACAGFNYQLDQQGVAAAVGQLLRYCELLSGEFADEDLVNRKGYKHYRV